MIRVLLALRIIRLHVFFCLVLVGTAGTAHANLVVSPDGSTYTINPDDPSPWTTTVGDGNTAAADNKTVVIQDGAGMLVENVNAISLHDNANITISGSISSLTYGGAGKYGTGANAVEVNSNSTITISDTGTIIKRRTSGNAEAVNVHGINNRIINRGTISTTGSAAIWFQDWTIPGSPNQRNRVDNYGVIEKSDGGNVIGSSAANSPNQPGIIFYNHANASVVGNLAFGGGDDDLIFEAGSGTQSVTGSISGGAGNDTLTLTGGAGTTDRLTGSVSSFETLVKDGAGRWDISGAISSVGGFTSVQVRQGILGLQGNNSNFNGQLIINPYYNPDGSVDTSRAGGDATATVISAAQSLPTNSAMTNNVYNYGVLQLDQTGSGSSTGTYQGQIVGTGEVQKTGAGTVILAPINGNTYTGGTWIKEGTLEIASDSALGQNVVGNTLKLGTDGSSATNGTLKVDNSMTLGANRGPVELLDGGGTFDTNGNTLTVNNQVTGDGGLTKTGEGTLLLSNTTSNYTGGTWVQQGVLEIQDDRSLGTPQASNSLTLGTDGPNATNGTLRIDSTTTLSTARGDVTLLDGGGTFDTNGYNMTVGNTIVDDGRLTKTGAGTLTLTSTSNSYGGGTAVEQGTLAIADDRVLGSGNVGLYDGTTLQLNANVTVNPNRNITLVGAPGRSTATIDTRGNTGTFNGAINGGGGLIVADSTNSGNGIVELHGLNNYQGGTTVKSGTLGINSDSSLGLATGRLQLDNATTLRLDADNISLDPTRAVTLAGQTATVDTQGYTGTVAGSIGGSGKLIVTASSNPDDSVLRLLGNNTYQGGTSIEAGTVVINSNSSLGLPDTALSMDAGTTLQLAGTIADNTRAITLNGAAGSKMTIDTQGNTATFSGPVTGAGTLVVDNTYSNSGGVVALYGQNTNTGGTWVKNNTTVAIKSQAGLGAGDIYLGDASANGTLRADAGFTLDNKKIYLNSGGGTVDTNGNNVTLAEKTLVNSVANNPPEIGTDGDFHKTGAGVLTVVGDQEYTGGTYVDGGTFRLDAVDPADPMANTKGLINSSSMTVAKGARLEGQGLVGEAGALTTNSGTIAPGLPSFTNKFDSTKPDFISLTLNGDYKATEGAVVEISTQLLDDSSDHGTLVIKGDVTPDSAVTGIAIHHDGGSGALTDYGIEIIRVLGAADYKALGEKFDLISDFYTPDGKKAVVVGAYVYTMPAKEDLFDPNSGGMFLYNGTNSDGTKIIHPGTPVYESYALMLGNLTRLSTLEQRVGHRNWLSQYTSSGEGFASLWDKYFRSVETRGIWVQSENSRGEYRPKLGTGRSRYDLRYHRVSLGIDAPVYMFSAGSGLIGGLNVNYLWGKNKTRDKQGDGKITFEGQGIGATLTWYDQSGFYLDGQARYNAYQSDIKSETMHANSHLIDNNDGHGYAFSLETGRIFNLTNTWSLTPQGQLSYAKAKFDKFSDSKNSVIVSDQAYESLEGRLGMAVNYECSFKSADGKQRRIKAYGLGNYYHEFEGDSTVSVSTVKYKSKVNKDWLGAALGGSYNWNNDVYSVYGELGARSSTKKFGKEHELTANVGFRMAF